MTDKIRFIPEGEEETVEFFVEAECQLAGTRYLLVTEAGDGDGEALILKELPGGETEEAVYALVEEDRELEAVCLLLKDDLEELGILLEA